MIFGISLQALLHYSRAKRIVWKVDYKTGNDYQFNYFNSLVSFRQIAYC
jgi:hypothetical protein